MYATVCASKECGISKLRLRQLHTHMHRHAHTHTHTHSSFDCSGLIWLSLAQPSPLAAAANYASLIALPAALLWRMGVCVCVRANMCYTCELDANYYVNIYETTKICSTSYPSIKAQNSTHNFPNTSCIFECNVNQFVALFLS